MLHRTFTFRVHLVSVWTRIEGQEEEIFKCGMSCNSMHKTFLKIPTALSWWLACTILTQNCTYISKVVKQKVIKFTQLWCETLKSWAQNKNYIILLCSEGLCSISCDLVCIVSLVSISLTSDKDHPNQFLDSECEMNLSWFLPYLGFQIPVEELNTAKLVRNFNIVFS